MENGKRFKDNRTLEVYEFAFATGVLSQVSVAAHEIARVLVAARGLEDVAVLGQISVGETRRSFLVCTFTASGMSLLNGMMKLVRTKSVCSVDEGMCG